MFPNINELVTKLDKVFSFVCNRMEALVKQGEATPRVMGSLEAEYGRFVEDRNNGVFARDMTQAPLVLEGRLSKQETLATLHPNGKRMIYGGHYANLGEEPFQVRLLCAGGESNVHTVPPGTSYPITSYTRGIVIIPVDGNEAFYQVVGR